MSPSKTIKYKALFLLLSFSLNSVVGFACSIGVDMGFNSHHHSQGGGKQHEHADADHHDEHDGSNSHKHHHEVASNYHSDIENNTVSFSSQNEENCCKDFVVGFNSLDKQLAKQTITQLKISHLSPFILSAFNAESNITKGYMQQLRIPPREIDFSPPDIHVFIKSFLI